MLEPKSNRPFVVNTLTGESTWVRPGMAPADPSTVSDPNEVLTFSCWVNDFLKADPLVGARLPLNLEADPAHPALVQAGRDGLLLCALVATIAPDCLSRSAIVVGAEAGQVPPVGSFLANAVCEGVTDPAVAVLGPGMGAMDNTRLAYASALVFALAALIVAAVISRGSDDSASDATPAMSTTAKAAPGTTDPASA